MTRPDYLLAVDPGESSGWALWERLTAEVWVLILWGRLDDVSATTAMALLVELQGVVGSWGGQHMEIEGQYLGDNPRTFEALIERRCYWVAAAELAGLEVGPPANPSAWIGSMTKWRDGATSEERIEAACRRRWPGLEVEGDEAAAVLLGARWIDRRGGVACAPHAVDSEMAA